MNNTYTTLKKPNSNYLQKTELNSHGFLLRNSCQRW